jgi:2-dehydro-3-deoxyphosphogluconate aldolase/(4S)-4-hydroxy-2-oxoglutarate aldolase
MRRIYEKRIIPAATVASPEQGLALAEALLAGGLDVVEFTFRTEGAAGAIRRVLAKHPSMLVGAGTVLTEAQFDAAVEAGARFVVAPGLNTELVARAATRGVPFIPGVMTPTEVDRAIRAGSNLLKFFPSEAMGGVAVLKALAGPFKHTGVKFVPTGGVDETNLRSYLDVPVVAAVGGSWMVSQKLVEGRDWGAITRLTREALEIVGGASL